MFKKSLRVFLLAYLMVGFNVHGAPSPGISYLMDEPLSLFDYGFIRLNEALRERGGFWRHRIKVDGLTVQGNAHYEWEKNRIVLKYTTYLPTKPKNITYKKVCAETVNGIKELLSISISEDEALNEVYNKMRVLNGEGINTYFTHYFYIGGSRPKDLLQELERITEISVEVINEAELEKFLPDYKRSSCKAPLLGEEIYYLDKQK